jgi:hypothetical protein
MPMASQCASSASIATASSSSVQLRRADLDLHGVRAGGGCSVDEMQQRRQVAVVVDAELGHA